MLKTLRRGISYLNSPIKMVAQSVLRRCGYIKIDEFHKSYILEKAVEGVDFLFHITDSDARKWYDIYATGSVWKEMAFIRDNLIFPGGTVIECGAHHGMTAITMANWVGKTGRVTAIEPGVNNFEVLKKNLILNSVENVEPLRVAVADYSGEVYFREDPLSSMGSHVRVAPEFSEGAVKAVKLDELSGAGARPDLIKIDTQGYVYQTLLGGKQTIEQHRPNLAIEIDSRKAIASYGDYFDSIFELIDDPIYEYFVQYCSSEIPVCMSLKKIYEGWRMRNNFTRDIHLFARNKMWGQKKRSGRGAF